jgi:hypothetical protein
MTILTLTHVSLPNGWIYLGITAHFRSCAADTPHRHKDSGKWSRILNGRRLNQPHVGLI